MSAASPRRAFVLVGTTLGVIYLASLAPGVTFWDAGEFASAVESFGIPHPPGTPLFILVARVWRLLFGFLPTAIATNLLAAACTAVADGAICEGSTIVAIMSMATPNEGARKKFHAITTVSNVIAVATNRFSKGRNNR